MPAAGSGAAEEEVAAVEDAAAAAAIALRYDVVLRVSPQSHCLYFELASFV